MRCMKLAADLPDYKRNHLWMTDAGWKAISLTHAALNTSGRERRNFVPVTAVDGDDEFRCEKATY